MVEVAAGGLRVSFEKLCKSWNFVLIAGDFGQLRKLSLRLRDYTGTYGRFQVIINKKFN